MDKCSFVLFLLMTSVVWAKAETSSTVLSSVVVKKFVNVAKVRTEKHIGKAYLDKEKSQPLYTERHKAIFKGEKLKESFNDYFDLNGKKIAELNSDYSRSLLMPTYIFRDFRTGSEEGLRFINGSYLIFRKKSGHKEETHQLKNIEKVFSCQGWHYYLVANFEQIQKDSLQMKLIFPSKLDYYTFRVIAFNPSDEEFLHLRLEFDSWILRLFAPYFDITYDKMTKKIIQYYGPSNILDVEGNIQNVYIFYQ